MSILDLINAARASRGLPALIPNARLEAAALEHAVDLARHPELTQGDSHRGSDGSTVWQRAQRAGYEGVTTKEVTGWAWGDWNEYSQMAYWQASPPHAAILYDGSLNEVGAAYLPDAPGPVWTRYWVVVFGRGVATDDPVEPPQTPVEPPVNAPYTSHVPIVVSAPKTAEIDLLRFKLADPDCWRVVRHPGGNQEDIQDMELGGGLFVRRKNALGEWHRYDDQFFYLVHDTSPAPGAEGIERVYTLYKDGRAGAPKSKRFQAVGEAWHEAGLHSVVFRAANNCRPLGENSGQAQNHSTIVRHERNYTFNRYGQNLTFDEVIFEKTGVEMQIYGRKDGRSCGWIGWSAPWGDSEPVEIHWDRGRMGHEPNRVCGF